MPATLTRILDVYKQLWAIWVADNIGPDGWAVLVKEKNRVRLDNLDNKPNPSIPTNLSPSLNKPDDFPRVTLDVGDMVDELDEKAMTFGSERGTCGREEQLTVTYVATVASRSLRVGEIDLLVPRMIGLIRAKPRDLGLGEAGTFIDGVGRIITRTTRTKKGLALGSLRNLTTIRIPVKMVFTAGVA